MKETDYKEGLAKYLVKKDKHLALNMEQARQLVEYIREYEDDSGMLPPIWDGMDQDHWISANEEMFEVFSWEIKNEKK